MRRWVWFGLLASGSAWAVPLEVPHQGRLLDGAGVPVAGTVAMTFTLFDVASGGAAVWSEPLQVEVDAGYYAVVLGRSTGHALDSELFERPLWLQITVGQNAPLPRQAIGSSPYAIAAGFAHDLVGGVVDAREIRVDGELVVDSTGKIVADVDDTLDALTCSHRQVPRFDNVTGAWQCAHETLLGLSCAAGQVAAWDTGGAAWRCADNTDAAAVLAAVEGQPLELAAGTTIGGTPSLDDADVLALVEGTALDLLPTALIGGRPIASIDDVAWSELDGVPTALADGAVGWGELTGVPTAFQDGAIAWSEVGSIPSALSDGAVGWSELTGVPTPFQDGAIGWGEVANVPATLSDGVVAWSEIGSMPTDLSDGQVDWSELTNVPPELVDGLDASGVADALTGETVDLGGGSTVGGDLGVSGDLVVGGGVQLGNDSGACGAADAGSLRWTAAAGLEVCGPNLVNNGTTEYAWAAALPKKVLWSGGCTTQPVGQSGWAKYCLDGTDFNTAAGYLSVATSGDVTVEKAGYYRFHMFTIQHGCGSKHLDLYVNGARKAYSHNNDTHDANWSTNGIEVVLPLRKGDVLYVSAHAESCNPYRWHAWDATTAHSRLQLEYVGAL